MLILLHPVFGVRLQMFWIHTAIVTVFLLLWQQRAPPLRVNVISSLVQHCRREFCSADQKIGRGGRTLSGVPRHNGRQIVHWSVGWLSCFLSVTSCRMPSCGATSSPDMIISTL